MNTFRSLIAARPKEKERKGEAPVPFQKEKNSPKRGKKRKRKKEKPFHLPSFLSKGRLLTVTVFLPKRNVEILLSRLSREKIPVLGLKMCEKEIKVKLRAQDYPLAIAIFGRMCYTVTKVKTGGVLAPCRFALKRVGAVLGAAVFLAVAFLAKPYVFSVEYRGSAAFRKEEMQAVLSEVGIAPFRPVSYQTLKEGETALLSRFPSLWFASVEKRGFYVTVTAENAPSRAEVQKAYSLRADRAGTLQSLTVLQGVPAVTVGEAVVLGQELVRGAIVVGTGETLTEIPAPVIAEAVLLSEYAEERVYPSQNQNLLNLLTFNALKSVGANAPQNDFSEIVPAENGFLYRVRFTYFITLTEGTEWNNETALG